MKIIMTARGYFSLKDEKYGIFEMDQAKAITELGHQVCVFGLDFRSIRHLRRFGIYKGQKDGMTIINISFPCHGLIDSWKTAICASMLKRAYKLYCQNYDVPDIIHAHFWEYAYYVVNAFGMESVPIVMTEHSSVVNTNTINERVLKKAEKAYKDSQKIIAVSSALANRIAHNFGLQCTVIPNIVDTDIFWYKQPRALKEKFTFIAVANLMPLKRINKLLEAYAYLLKIYQNVELIVIGDGVEKKELLQQALDSNIQDKVIFKGRMERKQISELMSKSDCFVLPSSSETFGVAYIEAMASGLPVIATRCGGPEDFVNESNGILVEVDNVDDLYNAMVVMIHHAHRYKSEEISCEIRKKFSKEVIGKRLVEVYKDLQ